MLMTLLKAHWPTILTFMGAVVLFVLANIALNQRDAARSEAAALKTELSLRDSVIEQQNAGIDRLAAQRKEDREAYLAGIRAANNRAVRLEVDAERILAMPAPRDPNEQCGAAAELLRKEVTR